MFFGSYFNSKAGIQNYAAKLIKNDFKFEMIMWAFAS